MILRDVSRETADRLEIFSTLLKKWNARINLVSRASLGDLRRRHFEDSAQLYRMVEHPVNHWADLGSGGGFPGLVIAIIARESGSPVKMTLVESDARKSAFLATVIREAGLEATLVTGRIEEIAPLKADIVSARALADLDTLLGYAGRHLSPGGIGLFPKGATWQDELNDAQSKWQFTSDVVKNEVEPSAVILHVRGISRV